MRFRDLPHYTAEPSSGPDVPLDGLVPMIERWHKNYGLMFDADFQRAHVWAESQQERFVEHLLSGGDSGLIRFNHPNWMGSFEGELIIVDGKQRLTACMRFMTGNIKAFGYTVDEFEDSVPYWASLSFRINSLKTRAEVLQWYIDLNAGGIAHTPAEIKKVKKLLENERSKNGY